jgi:signal peptidase
MVAPSETAAPQNDWTGRVGALSALPRPAAFRRGVRLLSYAVLGALIGVALLVATATLPVLFGYHTYVINGGSMAPALKAGSVAVSKPTSPYDLEIGDVIARRESPDRPPVLHRIVDFTVVDGQRLFVTQGDANRTPDPEPVAFEGTGDKVVFSVPYAGYILQYAGSGLGRLLVTGAPLALLAAIALRERWRSRRPDTGASTDTDDSERALPPDASPSPETEQEYDDAA